MGHYTKAHSFRHAEQRSPVDRVAVEFVLKRKYLVKEPVVESHVLSIAP